MENLSNLESGMNKAYRAVRGMLICLLLTWVPSLKLFAALGILAFFVFHIIGLYEAGKDIEGCRKAFILSVVSVIMAILSVSPLGIIRIFATLVRCGTEFLAVYLVCTSVSEVTDRIGAADVRREGVMSWQVNAVCYGLTALCSLLGGILYMGAFAMLTTIAIMLIPLVAKVFYMLFLRACDQALNGGRKNN